MQQSPKHNLMYGMEEKKEHEWINGQKVMLMLVSERRHTHSVIKLRGGEEPAEALL